MVKEREIPVEVLMRYFRVPTGDLPVDYPGRELLLGSRISNISVSGVFISTQKPLPKGSELNIEFRLPFSNVDIKATTIVRWSKAPEPARRPNPSEGYGMGLEFTKIGKRELKLIEKFVKEFLTRMRKAR